MSSRVASGATPSTSAHSGFGDCWAGSCAGAPPVENLSVICPIRNQMTMKPIAPARTMTRTPLSMLVEPHLRNGKLVELEIGLDARLQGTIVADELERIGQHAAIQEALVQIGHQHRAHDELECERRERLARELELPASKHDIDERDDRVRIERG